MGQITVSLMILCGSSYLCQEFYAEAIQSKVYVFDMCNLFKLEASTSKYKRK